MTSSEDKRASDAESNVTDLAIWVARSMCGSRSVTMHQLDSLRIRREPKLRPGIAGILTLVAIAGERIASTCGDILNGLAISSTPQILLDQLETETNRLVEGRYVALNPVDIAITIPESAASFIEVAVETLRHECEIYELRSRPGQA